VNSKVIFAAGCGVAVAVAVGVSVIVGVRVGVRVAVGIRIVVLVSSGCVVPSGLACMIKGKVSSSGVAEGEEEMAVGLGTVGLDLVGLDIEGLSVGTPVLLLSTQPLTINPNTNRITITDLPSIMCFKAFLSSVSLIHYR
jgi:hypothetical protein